jgi:diaminohydroxyphosphoribosylaminopyrimidine deaminase/5-amino-6-(5-phosphoribosylamino)uracil reductase
MGAAIDASLVGFPAPNPHVGCVIARGGEIVAVGYHDHAGGPHAERVALDIAGPKAEGADVFVTLEPCNHHGRTPPCSEALIKARVGRVFVACSDENPRAAGGAARLREAGIEVTVGLLADEAAAANLRFVTAQRLKRVHVTVKGACSLDGRIALPSGESQWITGEDSRMAGHALRADCGAVLVGYRTVLADDPELTARIDGVVNQPLRVVLDPDNRLTGKERVFNHRAETLHVRGRPIDLGLLAADLYQKGQIGLLVEGGARTIGQFFQARLVDLVEVFVAPKILGDGPSWVEGMEIKTLDEHVPLTFTEIAGMRHDLRLTAVPNWTDQA